MFDLPQAFKGRRLCQKWSHRVFAVWRRVCGSKYLCKYQCERQIIFESGRKTVEKQNKRLNIAISTALWSAFRDEQDKFELKLAQKVRRDQTS